MAGHVRGTFPEKLTPFLKRKHADARSAGSVVEVDVIARQYLRDARETSVQVTERRRHYQAVLAATFEDRPLTGVERLYRQSIILVLTTVCAAHCRWCLRGLYDQAHMSDESIRAAARFCSQDPDIREVVITGGDPFMAIDRLATTLASFARVAPGVTRVRIGTRVPLQDPARVTDDLLALLARHRDRVEIALHINHASELFPEVQEALSRLAATGVRLYNQFVLLKGVNDSVGALFDLADRLRAFRIEPHYLFHCVPIRGMSHHRTTVLGGLELHDQAFNSGRLSGRCRPVYALITDIGKLTMTEGTILAHEHGRLLLQSAYSYTERLRYNPTWRLPESASVDPGGLMRVWYDDGPEHSTA